MFLTPLKKSSVMYELHESISNGSLYSLENCYVKWAWEADLDTGNKTLLYTLTRVI
ncbi:hypothetical protein DSUL_50032 [Desulfovibrionales bacterium]